MAGIYNEGEAVRPWFGLPTIGAAGRYWQTQNPTPLPMGKQAPPFSFMQVKLHQIVQTAPLPLSVGSQGAGTPQPLLPELEDELLDEEELEDDELLDEDELDEELLDEEDELEDEELVVEDEELVVEDEELVVEDEELLDDELLDDVVSPLLVLDDETSLDEVVPLVVGTLPPTPPPPAPPTSVLRSPPCAQLATITPKIRGPATSVKRFIPGRIVSGIDPKRKWRPHAGVRSSPSPPRPRRRPWGRRR